MNWADWVIVTVIAISALFSVHRGFAREVLSLVIWISALILARTFGSPMAEVLRPYIETSSIRSIAAIGILFILTLIVGALISRFFGLLIKATGLSATDRVLGIIFGAARGGLIIIVLVMFLRQTPAVEDSWWQESVTIPHFILMETWTKSIANDIVGVIW